MNDRHFNTLLDSLQLSWSGYLQVRKAVKQRIRRYMQLIECRHSDQYLRLPAIPAPPTHPSGSSRGDANGHNGRLHDAYFFLIRQEPSAIC